MKHPSIQLVVSQQLKVKAAKTEHTIRHVCQVEVCHNDEIPLEAQIGYDFDELDESSDQPSLSWEEHEELSNAEGEGPLEVSDEVTRELEANAAKEELKKLQNLSNLRLLEISMIWMHRDDK